MQALSRIPIYLVPLLLVFLYGQSLTVDEFNYATVEELRRDPPDYIFIGDSNADVRVRPEYLSKHVPNAKLVKFTAHGSDIAVWYLQFKNFVVASMVRPKRVFIFLHASRLDEMRDKDAPGFYYTYLRETTPGYDPTFERLFYSRPTTWADWAYGNVVDRLEFDVVNADLTRKLNDLCISMFDDSQRFRVKLNARFSFRNFKTNTDSAESNELAAKTALVSGSAGSWDASFLREILDLARKADIELVFVRMRSRPNEDNVDVRSRATDRYFEALAAYIRRAGFRVYDLSREKALTRDMYKDKTHIGFEGNTRPRYAEIFYRIMEREFQ